MAPPSRRSKKISHLHTTAGNSDSTHHTFGNKKNIKSKIGTKSSSSSSSKPGPFSNSKDAASFSKSKTCTWCTKHYTSKANGHGWHECSKFKEFSKSVPKGKGNGKEQHYAEYNPDTDSEVEGLNQSDAEVSTTAKWIFNSRASTHMIPDAVLFQDIQPIRSEIRVRNSAGIPVYGIGTVSLFDVLKDGSIKNVMLKDCLYVPGLIKSLFS
jgi:hypothetical protein